MVEHTLGVTEVPVTPERVVVLNAGTALPVLLDLGVPVVGAPLPDGTRTTLFPADDLAGVTSLGFPEPSLEVLAGLDPDLIVGLGSQFADRYDVLSEVAPTVIVEENLLDWRATTRSLADAVGRLADADRAIAEYDAAVAALAEDLGAALDTEVSVVRALGDRIRVHTRFHFAGQVIDDVGLARPPAQVTDDPAQRLVEVSPEEIEIVDGDVLFVYGAGGFGSASDADEIDANVAALQASPLWPTLDIANSDAVFTVDPLAWQQGGLPAARVVLDDLRRALLAPGR